LLKIVLLINETFTSAISSLSPKPYIFLMPLCRFWMLPKRDRYLRHLMFQRLLRCHILWVSWYT